ncbi:hypothetical protein [Limnobacter sp. UBA3510]|uniref:hypothetical protein n=1 Tax=uncultured Limnobacter sp. TaxID=199681 RepID=UPI0025BA317D|nr:hypothetical protein [Limnobacter sp. UBA3510]
MSLAHAIKQAMPQQKNLGPGIPVSSLIKQQTPPIVLQQSIAKRPLRGQQKRAAFIKQSQGIAQATSTIGRQTTGLFRTFDSILNMKRIDQLLYFGKGKPHLAVIPIVGNISCRDLANVHKAFIVNRPQVFG